MSANKPDKRGYYRELYQTHKLLKLCVKCGKQDAYTLNGRSYCYDCAEQFRTLKRSKESLDKRNKTKRNKYAERKANHQCVKCGKQLPPNAAFVMCHRCLSRQRANRERNRRNKGILSLADSYINVCMRCRKNPKYKNFKLCKECYDTSCASLVKARTNCNAESFRQLNNAFFTNYQ